MQQTLRGRADTPLNFDKTKTENSKYSKANSVLLKSVLPTQGNAINQVFTRSYTRTLLQSECFMHSGVHKPQVCGQRI